MLEKTLALTLSFSVALCGAPAAASAAAVTAAPSSAPGFSAGPAGLPAEQVVGQVGDLLRSDLISHLSPAGSDGLTAPISLLAAPAQFPAEDHALLAGFMTRIEDIRMAQRPLAPGQLILPRSAASEPGPLPAGILAPAEGVLIARPAPLPFLARPGSTIEEALEQAGGSGVLKPDAGRRLAATLDILRQETREKGRELKSLSDGEIIAAARRIFDQASPAAPYTFTFDVSAPPSQLTVTAPAEAAPAFKPGVMLTAAGMDLLPLLQINMEKNSTMAGHTGDTVLGRIFGDALSRIFSQDASAQGVSLHYSSERGLYLPEQQFGRAMDVVFQMQRLEKRPLADWLASFAPEAANPWQLDRTTLSRRLRWLDSAVEAANAGREKPLPRMDASLGGLDILLDENAEALYPGNRPGDAAKIFAWTVAKSLEKANVPSLRPLGAFRLGNRIYFLQNYAERATPAQMAATVLALRMGEAGFSPAEIDEAVPQLTEKAFHKAESAADLRKLAPYWAGSIEGMLQQAVADQAPGRPAPAEKRLPLPRRALASAAAAWGMLRAGLPGWLRAAAPYLPAGLAATAFLAERIISGAPLSAWQLFAILVLGTLGWLGTLASRIWRDYFHLAQLRASGPSFSASEPSEAPAAIIWKARALRVAGLEDHSVGELSRQELLLDVPGMPGRKIRLALSSSSGEEARLEALFIAGSEVQPLRIVSDDEFSGNPTDAARSMIPASEFSDQLGDALRRAGAEYQGDDGVEAFLSEFLRRLGDLEDGGDSPVPAP